MRVGLLIFLFLILQTTADSQCELPANIDINRNVLTIANYSPANCGFLNSEKTNRSIISIEDLVEVMDSTGAYDLGSGFVYEFKGEKFIITCEHVIFKSDRIVGYDSNYKAYDLELVGGDTFYDVAVLRFKNQKDAANWKGIRFDFTPQQNSEVFAIGYWKWNKEVSAEYGNLLSEDIDLTDRKLPVVKIGFLKSDAPTDSGFSGGALFNSEGQVIGMNNAVHVQNKTSFALQSSILNRVIQDIINSKTQSLQRSFLGIQFTQKLSEGNVVMNNILTDTPAFVYRNQLKGKTILSIEGKRVTEIYDVLKIMENMPPGKEITLETPDKKVSLTTDLLSDKHHKAITLHAVRKHKGDECNDIEINNGSVSITTNKRNKEAVKTAGLNDDRIYCLNDLVDLGKLVRIFSLHGELRIGTDDQFNKGRWIWFSNDDYMRVLYY